MITEKFETKEEWMLARRGKITGSRLKDVVTKRGTGKKIGYYELIAERLGLPADNSISPMDRGVNLESEAMDRFESETKKHVNKDLVIWMRDDNESIAISPDGFIGKTEAVEIKCLSSARHIEAILTKEIPDEYRMQGIQYFIVNDDLETLHFVFYDPRLELLKKSLGYFTIDMKRSEVQPEVEEYLIYQRKMIQEIDTIVNSLTF